ncbi:MAG TPA: ERF family protein [Tissierellia bacterium]|nr:ERF family protein [Tissierellia bacterium]
MNKSDSIKNLAAALAKFQGEVKNPANTADNPFFKSKYAPLQDVLNIVRPLLSRHGLSIIQIPQGDGANVSVSTLLLHESGEWIELEPLVLKADKPTAQGAGSAITYARRYSLSAVLGISSEDDDDGNHATGNKQGNTYNSTSKAEGPKTKDTTKSGTISKDQAKWLFGLAKGDHELVKDTLQTFGYKNTTDIKTSEYGQICKVISEAVKNQKEDKK